MTDSNYKPAPKSGFSRRDFLRGSSAAAAVSALHAPGAAAQPQGPEVVAGEKKVFCYMGSSGQGSTDATGIFSTMGFDEVGADNFRQLAARDRIFLFGAPAPWKPEDNTDYLIDSIATDGKLTFSRMGMPVPVSMTGINFRAGYLPSAVRFTLKIMDTKGMQVRTITRVVRIQSR